MKSLRHRNIILLAGVCCAAVPWPGPIPPAHSESSPQTASSSGPTKRWVQFELSEAGSTGDPQTGKPVTLTIFLEACLGTIPVVATCESITFRARRSRLSQMQSRWC